jgi:hypothetical protein
MFGPHQIGLASSIYDPYPGDVRNARFEILVDGTATPACSNLQPSLITTSDTRFATVGCDFTFAIPAGQTSYTPSITVIADSESFYAPRAGDTVFPISVAVPSQKASFTGGGFFVNTAPSGTYAGAVGMKTNFGFNAKYNADTFDLQGEVNVIVRARGHVYQIDSTSLSSLSIPGAGPESYGALIARANVLDITDPANAIPLDTDDSLQITFHDNGTPGTNDTIGISVYRAGGLRFASDWNGTDTTEKLLGGGNLSIQTMTP